VFREALSPSPAINRRSYLLVGAPLDRDPHRGGDGERGRAEKDFVTVVAIGHGGAHARRCLIRHIGRITGKPDHPRPRRIAGIAQSITLWPAVVAGAGIEPATYGL
jgi:hypothetical protein